MFEVLVKIPDDKFGEISRGFDAVKDPHFLMFTGFFFDSLWDCIEHPDKDGFSLLYVDSKQKCELFCKALTDAGLEAKAAPI